MVEILNEAYEVKIEIADPKLRDLTLNTTFKGESLDNILYIISETLRIKVHKEGEKIILQ